MDKRKHKIFRYLHADYGRMWEKEAQIIDDMRAGELAQCLLLFRCDKPTLVLPAGRKWQASENVIHELEVLGWQVLSRRSGGAPVPQTPGLINISHFYLWPEDSDYSVKLAYAHLCTVLQLFFSKLGIATQVHATPNSFCDGDYNLNVNGRKIVGTAQRVISVRGGRKLVLAQACIIVNDDVAKLVAPVNLVNKLHGYAQDIAACAHTCIADHIQPIPDIERLYSNLVDAVIQSGLYHRRSTGFST